VGGGVNRCQIGYYGRSVVNQRCGLIRRKFGRNKKCPIPLKKALDTLKELETKQNMFQQEKKEFLKLGETIKYKKLIEHYSWKGGRKHTKKINNQKIKIITMLPGYTIIT
jgi:hypothetical protein